VVAERVLVVDDDAGLLALICEDLQTQGLACAGARTDREAYRLLASGPAFDAVVVDVNLGLGTTGFDVARRARQVTPQIRVVYMSGEANARHWMTFGVPSSDYVSKPFPLERLAELLRHDLGLDRPKPAPAGPSLREHPQSDPDA
jgi:DNA-binding NtrC family response regulator